MADGECLENLVCLQLCNGKPDESACQVRLHLDALEKGVCVECNVHCYQRVVIVAKPAEYAVVRLCIGKYALWVRARRVSSMATHIYRAVL